MGSKHRQFFRHVLKGRREHGRATWQHDMNVQILAGVNVTLHDVVEKMCRGLRWL